jgi:hypothetical protein
LSFSDQDFNLLDHKVNVVVRSRRSSTLVVVLSSSDGGNLRLAARLVTARCSSTALVGSRATTPVVIHLSIELFGSLSGASLWHGLSIILLLRSRTASVTTFTATFATISVFATSTRTASSLTRCATITTITTITATTTTSRTARAAGASTARGKVTIDVARVGTSTAALVDAIEQAAVGLFDVVKWIARGAGGFLDGEVDRLAHGILTIELAESTVGEVWAGVDDVGDTLGTVMAVVKET